MANVGFAGALGFVDPLDDARCGNRSALAAYEETLELGPAPLAEPRALLKQVAHGDAIGRLELGEPAVDRRVE